MDPVLEIVDGIEQLPTLPDVAVKAMRALEGDDPDLRKVGDLIALDAALSSHVMRLANSVLFGGSGQVTNVTNAVLRLGQRELKNLVLTVSVMKSVPELPAPYDARGFWSLGLASAVTARRMAKDLRHHDPEEAYLAGLVHGIGEAALAVGYTERFQQAIATADRDGLPFRTALTEEFGCCYSEIGGVLLERWGFPESVTAAIRHQFDPSAAGESEGLASIVFAADCICRDLGLGIEQHEDAPWVGALTQEFTRRVEEAGYPDISFYMMELREDLDEIDGFARSVFGQD